MEYNKMEGIHSHSFFVCQQIIQNTILAKTFKMLPPSWGELGVFSCVQTSKLEQALIESGDYFYDAVPNRMSEDVQTRYCKRLKLKGSELITPKSHQRSQFCRLSRVSGLKYTKTPKHNSIKSNILSQMMLIPLNEGQLDSHYSNESQSQKEIKYKLRKRKLLQHQCCSKYDQILKQSSMSQKHNSKKHKTGSSTVNDDLDETVIQNSKNSKQNTIKILSNCLDLEVEMHESYKEQKAEKDGIEEKVQENSELKILELPDTKKKEVKVVEDNFLKDMGNIKLIESKQSKQEFCKITFKGNQLRVKKRRIDVWKQNENGFTPIKIEDLRNGKNHACSRTQVSISKQYEKRQPYTSFGPRAPRQQNTKIQLQSSNKSKLIKIFNRRALEFLLGNEPNYEELSSCKKKITTKISQSVHNNLKY